MDIHDVCSLFPMMTEEEFAGLKTDIDLHGQREPILTYRGKVIDGRNRLLACEELGIKPIVKEWDGDGSLVEFIVSLNLHRRHLNQGQRAAVGVEILTWFESEAKERQRASGQYSRLGRQSDQVVEIIPQPEKTIVISPKARDQAAKLVGTNPRYIQDAKTIKSAAPDLHEQVKAGTITLPKAKQKVRQIAKDKLRQAARIQQSFEEGINDSIRLERLLQCRFQDADIEIEDSSLDWIVCDPPYGTDYIEIYGEFSDWAARKLRPNGSAIVMTGQGALDRLLGSLCRSLNYVWTLAYVLEPGSHFTNLPGLHLVSGWKPVFWLCKSTKPDLRRTSADYYLSLMVERAKFAHPWQQGQEFFEWLIEKFTVETELICDPFLGSGTTGLACQKLGRHFVGCESNPETFRTACERIHGSTSVADVKLEENHRSGLDCASGCATMVESDRDWLGPN